MSASSHLRILLVDEDPAAGTYVARWLGANFASAEIHQVQSQAALTAAFTAQQFDLLICEAHLSWSDGQEVLRTVRQRLPDHPALMLVRDGDEELAVAAMQAGFDDYVRKRPDLDGRLVAAIDAALTAGLQRAGRREADEALREAEARNRVIVQMTSDGIITIDERGLMEFVNPSVGRIFGYEPDDLLGQNVSMLMPHVVAHEHDGYLCRFIETGKHSIIGIGRTVEGRRKDGTLVRIDLSVTEIQLAGRRLFTGTIRDLSERVRAESERLALIEREQAAINEARREAAEKSLILENMQDAVIVTDRDGRFSLVNSAAVRLLGQGGLNLVGLALHEQPWQLLYEDGRPIRYDDRPIVGALRGKRTTMLQQILFPDGRTLMVRASCSPLRNDAQEIVGAVHVVHDVTEEHVRARQAAQNEKLRSLGQLAGGVAHDLNQFLGLVVGYGDLASQAIDASPIDRDSVRDSLATMVRAAEDGADAVRRLLLFARPNAEGLPSRVDLDDILRQVAKLTAPRWRDAAQQQGRTISLDIEVEGEVAVDGWAGDLREVFTNLVFNAIDALPRGGTVKLVARNAGNLVIAEVADDGLGMTPDVRERLFEPFFSTKGEGGSGLGLAIVFGIVERHSGSLTVESSPGQGTAFRLSFPASAQAEDSGEAADVARAVRELRILVVDDEPALVSMLARILRSDDHQVATASSGEEALDVLAHTVVDVVISDLGMGAGMNGWELAAAIRTMPNPPDFILTTGWGAEIDPEEATRRGVRAVVSKPYRLPGLRNVLASL